MDEIQEAIFSAPFGGAKFWDMTVCLEGIALPIFISLLNPKGM